MDLDDPYTMDVNSKEVDFYTGKKCIAFQADGSQEFAARVSNSKIVLTMIEDFLNSSLVSRIFLMYPFSPTALAQIQVL